MKRRGFFGTIAALFGAGAVKAFDVDTDDPIPEYTYCWNDGVVKKGERPDGSTFKITNEPWTDDPCIGELTHGKHNQVWLDGERQLKGITQLKTGEHGWVEYFLKEGDDYVYNDAHTELVRVREYGRVVFTDQWKGD